MKVSEFLLLLHEPTDGFSDYSPEDMQAVVEKYTAWAQGLGQQGKIIESRKLKDDGGRLVRRGENGMTLDGPFSETKEVIGGFFLIKARDYGEALQICANCPHLEYGTIQLREIEVV